MNCTGCGRFMTKASSPYDEGPDEYQDWKCSSCGTLRIEWLSHQGLTVEFRWGPSREVKNRGVSDGS